MRRKMEEFIRYLRAKDNLIYAFTYEENEFIEDLCSAIRKMTESSSSGFKVPARIFTYTRPTGMYEIDIMNPLGFDPNRIKTDIRNMNEAFEFVRTTMIKASSKKNIPNIIEQVASRRNNNKNSEREEEEENNSSPAIFIFKDLHLFFNDKDIMRTLRDLKENYLPAKNQNYCPIIVTSPVMDIPPELEKIFTLYEYPLMDKQEIYEFIKPTADKCKISKEGAEEIAASLVGLTKRECLRALMHSIGKNAPERIIKVQDLHEEKMQIVKKSGALDFIVPQHTLADLGGCDNFKTWVKKVKESMSEEARAFGLPQPKGAMLVGVPGTSKTVSAEILASYLNIPLLSLNIARVMGSFVGQSEHRILEALRIAKSVAPCVLLFDEMEKTLGGVQSSNSSDSGTLSRVMSQILNFLQEDNTGIVTIMTSNDVTQLPPELTRSGRIDAQWMFDLPNEFERSEIADIYLKQANLSLDSAAHTYLVQATENFTGAEIKNVVKEIMVNVFYRQKNAGVKTFNRNVEIEDIKDAVANVVTVWKSSREKIEAFKRYASDRYLNASKSQEELQAALNTSPKNVVHSTSKTKSNILSLFGDK